MFVVFALAGAEYALPLAAVFEIAQPLAATPVPNTPGWVLGVTSVGGDIVPMVDLGSFLGLAQGPEADTRLLVVRNRNADHTTGLVVDRVTGVRTLPPEHVAAADAIDERVAPFLRGVVQAEGRSLPVFDPDLLMQTPEMQQFGVM
jgi:chemotaxis signal transduction protein